MSRLEEVKHLVGYVNKAVEDDDGNNVITTLIELTSEGHIDWLIKQAERVEELEDIIYKDARQAVLEDMYEENKRYREAIENIEQQIKKNDERIERLSKEPQFYDRSSQVEALHGEALGLEMALWIINQSLKGESQ